MTDNEQDRPRVGRPRLNGRAMTSTERRERSRVLRAAAIVGEADLAAQHIRAARRVGAKEGALHLTDALRALARLQELIRP